MGGYHGRNTPIIFLTCLVIAACFAFISILTTRFLAVSLSIMLELFFGGVTVPVITGYMLTQVPPKMRTIANSVATLFYNLFGFFPAPALYGMVYQAKGSGSNRWGLISI